MKRAAFLFVFMLCLSAYVPLSAQGAQPLDRIRLKDGRTVSGQIVEERAASIVMLVRGARRTYDRSFITRISYGDDLAGPDEAASGESDYPGGGAPGPDAAAYDGGSAPGSSIPTAPPRPAGGLVSALALRYRVPLRDVLWVRAQGVGDSDLPLVFLIAATARVTPRQVLALFHKGWTWDQIEDYYQMEPDAVVAEPSPWEADPYYYYDPDFYVDLGWGWGGGYGYGWGGRGGWGNGRGNWGGRGASGGRGDWGNGRGNWGGRGDWGGGSGGGRVPIGSARGGGGGWSGGGHVSGGGRVAAGGGGGRR